MAPLMRCNDKDKASKHEGSSKRPASDIGLPEEDIPVKNSDEQARSFNRYHISNLGELHRNHMCRYHHRKKEPGQYY